MNNFEVNDIDKHQLKANLQKWRDGLIANVSKKMEELRDFNFFINKCFDGSFKANDCMVFKYDDSGCKTTSDKKGLCIHWSFINDEYVNELREIVDSFVFKMVQDIVKNQIDESPNKIIGCSDKFSFKPSVPKITEQEWVKKALNKESTTALQQGQEDIPHPLKIKFYMFLLVKALSFMGKKTN